LRLRRGIQEEHNWKKLGGNADGCENKGVVKIAAQKALKTKKLRIDGLRDALRVAEGRRDETGTLSAEPWIIDIPHPLLFVK
jgi:hypothetical protein